MVVDFMRRQELKNESIGTYNNLCENRRFEVYLRLDNVSELKSWQIGMYNHEGNSIFLKQIF